MPPKKEIKTSERFVENLMNQVETVRRPPKVVRPKRALKKGATSYHKREANKLDNLYSCDTCVFAPKCVDCCLYQIRSPSFACFCINTPSPIDATAAVGAGVQ